MLGFHGKRDCHGVLKKAWLELSLESIRKPWGLSNGIFWEFYAFSVCDFFVIDLYFCLCLVHDHATLFVI